MNEPRSSAARALASNDDAAAENVVGRIKRARVSIGVVLVLATCLGAGVAYRRWINQLLLVQTNDIRALETALRWGGDPNARDRQGVPALVLALNADSSATTARMLVESGADVNVRDARGAAATLLGASLRGYNRELMRIMLSKCSDRQACRTARGIQLTWVLAQQYQGRLYLSQEGRNVAMS